MVYTELRTKKSRKYSRFSKKNIFEITKDMFRIYKDNRYRRAIKQALNKHFNNKSSENKNISQIISQFSHKTLLKPGTYLLTKALQYFVITSLLSNHWVTGYFCPCRLHLENDFFYYIPNIWRRTSLCRKKIFEPFSDNPYIKTRNTKFFVQKKTNEQVPDFTGFFASMY